MKFRAGRPLLLAVFFIIVLVADQIRCDDEPATESVKPAKRKTKKSKAKKLATKNLKKVRPDRPQADRPQAQAPEYDSAYDYGDNYDYGTDPDYDGESAGARNPDASFRQPDDEIPRVSTTTTTTTTRAPEPESIVQPFTCYHEGKWYREGEVFQSGYQGCATCRCRNGSIQCDEADCPRNIPTTTTTTTTTTTEQPEFDASAVGNRLPAAPSGEPGIP
uniref:VWFC domain-containing protein n=1 Tax=Anopheles maculatus TaxID=74869 RepID=A0A182SUT8_9DIPT